MTAGDPSRSGAAVGPGPAWQRMLSGRRLDLLDPAPSDIDLHDIAHGLARVARWNGQTRGPYILSVAQHSLLVEALVGHIAPRARQVERLTALLHDAPEYVVGDLISPFKACVGDTYKAVEARLFAAILSRFALPPPDATLLALIKRADRAAARLEAVLLAGFDEVEAEAVLGPPEPGLDGFAHWLAPRPSDQVEASFVARCRSLGVLAT